jgi:hypothetical protein
MNRYRVTFLQRGSNLNSVCYISSNKNEYALALDLQALFSKHAVICIKQITKDGQYE